MANAGVVGMAEVIVPNGASTNQLAGSPAMWAFTWVGVATLFLVMIHMAIIGRAGR